MKRLFLILLLAACAWGQNGQVQVGNFGIQYVTAAPASSCSSNSPLTEVMGVGTVYTCQGGSWALIAGGTTGAGISGTPTVNQIAMWVDAANIKGVTVSGDGTINSSGVLNVSSLHLSGPTTNAILKETATGNAVPSQVTDDGTTVTFGTAGQLGTLALFGSSSGSVTQVPQATAGTPTITWGTSSGTPSVVFGTGFSMNTTTGQLNFTPGSFTTTVNGTGCTLNSSCSPNTPLNQVVSPTGAIATIANGNNPLTITSAQTTNTQTAVAFNEVTAATGTTDVQVGATTLANSTASVAAFNQGAISSVFPAQAVLIAGGNNTGATNVPALNITSTWNNVSLTGPLFAMTLTNTSSAAGSTFIKILGGASAITDEFDVTTNGTTRTATAFENTLAAGNTEFAGGLGLTNTAVTAGAGTFHGSDNSLANASAHGGLALLRGGELTNATPNAASMEGATQVASGFLKGSAVAALGDVVCGTTTAYTVTDCSKTGPAVNIVGIATSTTNPIGVVTGGQALVKTDGAVTIGDILCMGTTTDGQAHDNGTVPCPTATSMIGVVLATSGSPVVMTGSTIAATAMSTTLPLVQLQIQPVIAAMPATSTVTGADYTNTTTTPSTVWSFTLPATAAAKSYKYICSALWESTAATLVGPVIGLNLSAAPTQLTGSAWAQSTLTGTDTTGYLSNTTTGSQTLITAAAAGVTSTNYRLDIWGTIEGAATAGSTFIINAASTSGTTASLNIRRGGQCTLSQIVATP